MIHYCLADELKKKNYLVHLLKTKYYIHGINIRMIHSKTLLADIFHNHDADVAHRRTWIQSLLADGN